MLRNLRLHPLVALGLVIGSVVVWTVGYGWNGLGFILSVMGASLIAGLLWAEAEIRRRRK